MNVLIKNSFVFLILFSCSDNPAILNSDPKVIIPNESGLRDTFNMIDANGKKQGQWSKRNDLGILEEGSYVDNKREGIWKLSYTDEKLALISYTVQYRNDTLQKQN